MRFCCRSLAFALALTIPAAAQRPQLASLANLAWQKLLRQYDADQDGRVARAEYPRGDAAFRNLDRDGDGAITRGDLDIRPRRAPRVRRGGEGRRGEPGATGAPVAPTAPAVGEPAPDFELPLLGMKEQVALSSFRGQQPVALVFGSWT